MLDVSAQQKDVAHRVRAGLGTIQKCWAAAKRGQPMETKAKSGRPKILNRAVKIVISKSFLNNLVSGRPNRIKKVLELKGYYISK